MIKLDLPPGLYKSGTEYQSQGRFYDADLWRWFAGEQRPIGGWRAKTSAFAGRGRDIITWLDNAGSTRAAVGTNEGLFAISRSGTVNSVSPSGFTAGSADAIAGGGYGFGTYGTGLYGVPRPDDTSIIPAPAWTLDTWGEYLVGAWDGTIYEWQLNTGVAAAAIVNAPAAESVMVTEERIMMALASGGDPRAVAWSTAEDNTVWTPSGTNLAGGKRLQTNGRILMGRRVQGGSLIWTDVDVHRAEYVGLPQVYRFNRLATGCGAISKGAAVFTGSDCYWMGANGFWRYDGGVTPLESEVSGFLFRNINRQQISKVRAMHNSSFGEVWWMYPSATVTECDRVVTYNYRENHWNDFALVRMAGVDRGVFTYPLMVGLDGKVYEHEVGHARDGRTPYAMTGPLELGDGTREMEVNAIIPDDLALGDVAVSFTTGDWPMSADEVFGPYSATEKTDCRFQARRVAAKFTAVADQTFRLGSYRFDVQAGAKR